MYFLMFSCSMLYNNTNCRFDIHVQKEGEWGTPYGGKFDGMMGELQREEVDFCTISAPTPERLQALDYVRGYPSDVLILTSLKPTLLPENMALVRPLEGSAIICICICNRYERSANKGCQLLFSGIRKQRICELKISN